MGQIQQGGGKRSRAFHRAEVATDRPVTLPLESVLIEIEQRILKLHQFASKRFDTFQRKLELSTDKDEAEYQRLCDGYENALSVCDDAERLVTLLRKLR